MQEREPDAARRLSEGANAGIAFAVQLRLSRRLGSGHRQSYRPPSISGRPRNFTDGKNVMHVTHIGGEVESAAGLDREWAWVMHALGSGQRLRKRVESATR